MFNPNTHLSNPNKCALLNPIFNPLQTLRSQGSSSRGKGFRVHALQPRKFEAHMANPSPTHPGHFGVSGGVGGVCKPLISNVANVISTRTVRGT